MKLSAYLLNFFVVVLTISLFALLGVFAFWWYQNNFEPSTKFEDAYVAGPWVLKPGDNVSIRYNVTRYKDCKLEIGRFVRRGLDRREVLMQSVVQNIVASPRTKRLSGYDAEIPKGILNPGESCVFAEAFSKVQYFCNGLDYARSRVVDMEPVPLVICATEADKMKWDK